MESSSSPVVRPPARRWVVAIAAAVVVVGLISVALLARTNEGSESNELSVDFTPVNGLIVPSDDVRDTLVSTIEGLLAEPFVSIESVGFTEGRRSDVAASVDVLGRSMWSREIISDGVEVGAPRSSTPLVSERVVLGNDAWLRILQPTAPTDTPFQFIDATGSADQYLQGAYTQLGRVCDSLSVLVVLLSTVPFEAEQLGSGTVNGSDVAGVRTTFNAQDVADFLEANQLAEVGIGFTGDTVFEFWYDGTGLRQLVATGTQFQDGEALQTSARIRYRALPTLTIEVPSNTTP